jgi:uncharacterized membrane protein
MLNICQTVVIAHITDSSLGMHAGRLDTALLPHALQTTALYYTVLLIVSVIVSYDKMGQPACMHA